MSKYTKEQHLAHVAAWWDGKLEFRHYVMGAEWSKCIHLPDPNRPDIDYRIRPEPRLRPWKPEEVPVGAVLKARVGEFIIMGRNDGRYVHISEPNKVMGGWQIFDTTDCMYSTDHGASWKPCGVEEQS